MNASDRLFSVFPRLFEVLPGRVGPFECSPAVVDAARRLGVALGVAVRCVSGVVEDLDAVWVECGDGVHQCALQQHLAAVANGRACESCALWQRLLLQPRESCTLAATLATLCGVLALTLRTTRIDATVKLRELHELHSEALVQSFVQGTGLASCKTLEAALEKLTQYTLR